MSAYYLRVAGTNFGTFIADTQDLSTVRGGSLLLREAVRRVERLPGLEPVTTGGSEGLFRFEAGSVEDAGDMRRNAEAALDHGPLVHATLTVDVVRDTGDFRRDKEAAIAAGRWRQMQSPSLAIPSPEGETAEPCALDRLRPASGRRRKGDDPISESVYQRREHGRARKQDFYREETGVDVPEGFSIDLEALTIDPTRGSLDGKMAVLYLDGNRFGKLQRRHVRSVETQRTFDRTLQDTRQAVLRELLEAATRSPALREAGGAIRLETLLWGGDEIAWVLPGWAGLWAAALFFRDPRRFTYGDEVLTHAAGLVLCHHNAPIHRMRALAEDLAGIAKKRDRERNLLAYEVLESFDDVGDDHDAYRRRRTPKGVEPDALLLDPERLDQATAAYGALRPHLPARQIHAALRALWAGKAGRFDDALRKVRAAIQEAGVKPAYRRLVKALGAEASENAETAALLHLGVLGEYLAPLEEVSHD